MAKSAYETFLRFVIEHAHPSRPHHSWQEVIGFLFGRFANSEEETEVYITDVLPMDSGSSVYVKVGDYTPIYPVLTEKLEHGEFIVGWIQFLAFYLVQIAPTNAKIISSFFDIKIDWFHA